MTFLEVDTKPESFFEKFGVIDRDDKNRINAMFGSLEEFCSTKYDGRSIQDVIAELHSLEGKPKFKPRLFSMMQNYVNHLASTRQPATIRSYFLLTKTIPSPTAEIAIGIIHIEMLCVLANSNAVVSIGNISPPIPCANASAKP